MPKGKAKSKGKTLPPWLQKGKEDEKDAKGGKGKAPPFTKGGAKTKTKTKTKTKK